MELLRVSNENGRWQSLLQEWEAQCTTFGENFDEYAVSSLSTLRPLAEQTQLKTSGVYALVSPESRYMVHAN